MSATAFQERLTATADQIEVALGGLLAGPRLADGPPRLVAAMRHAILGGGKRLRPFLVLESARLCGGTQADAMPAALSLELIHGYSLVHDDLPAMDNDTLRRGRPTVWSAFDDWTAILVGDALHALAFEILADLPDAAIAAQLCLGLARSSGTGGMVGGQAIDLEADKLGKPATADAAHIRRLQAMKTGALIAFSCEAGAISAGASRDQREALLAYGRHLGSAFQIADDILDVEGDAEKVGKAVAKDAAANKATLVSLLGIDAARAELAEAVAQAKAALDIFPADETCLFKSAADFVAARES